MSDVRDPNTPVQGEDVSLSLYDSQSMVNAIGGRVLSSLKIGGKLNIGFGILVAMTLLVIGLNYLASSQATANINRTTDLSAPTALASSRAQANLLTMLAEVRGYLALGDEDYRVGYRHARDDFETDLVELENLAHQYNPLGSDVMSLEFDRRLEELNALFIQWSKLPEQLFDLRDDQLQREPALRLLLEDGNPLIATIVVNMRSIIDSQQKRQDLSADDIVLLGDMGTFQASFIAMIAGLRGYVTTGRDNFKFEYVANLTINGDAWEKLIKDGELLNFNQRSKLADIAQARDEFLLLPPRMFEAVEGDHAREDLYLFRTQAVPLAENMLQLLSEMTMDRQNLLQVDLGEGRAQLRSAQWQTLVGGVVALLLGMGLAFIFKENIAGPVRRLTNAAERIGAGDLAIRAPVESGDEIGILADTFNKMTGRLGKTLTDLDQRRKDLQVAAERLRGQNEYLGALHDTSLGLISRLDLNDLLEALVKRAGQLLGVPYGYIYLAEPGAQELELKVAVGISGQQIGERVKLGEGLAGKVWKSGQPIVVDDYDAWSGRSPEVNHNMIRAIMGIPLTHNPNSVQTAPQVMGVIGLGYSNESVQTFGENEIELLSRFAQLASIALDNARLYTAAREYLQQVAKVTDAAVAVEAGSFDPNCLTEVAARPDELGQLARVFRHMAHEVYTREQLLKQQVASLRIEVDKAKQSRQVAQIISTDYFRDLKSQAQDLRNIVKGDSEG